MGNTKLRKANCVNGLRDVGVRKGDIVMLHASLNRIGNVAGLSEKGDDLCKWILSIFNEALDLESAGTLVVPTFSLSYARYQAVYIHEETPADPSLGILPEYVRRQSQSLRSLHPLLSLTAIGLKKSTICGNVCKHAYGINSPFHRLYENNGKILLLGVGFDKLSFIHHIEFMAGVTYYYNKAYFTPVYKDGVRVALPFTAGVRYYNNKVESYYERMEENMGKKGLVKTGCFGKSMLKLVDVKELFEEGYSMIQKDHCFFIKSPYYTTS